jgi:hypothetical protein
VQTADDDAEKSYSTAVIRTTSELEILQILDQNNKSSRHQLERTGFEMPFEDGAYSDSFYCYV